MAGAASVVVSAIASTATVGLLAVFLLFFLVNDADRAIAWTLQLAEPRQRDQIAAATVTARRRLGRSLRETGLRAVLMGAVALVTALVLGLPAPLALGVLVFVGGFIPLLGLVATTAAVGLVALGTSGGVAAIVAVSVLAAATVLLPRVLRPARWEGHGVHPALVLVALTVGAVVAGPLGLILAVPVAIVLREVVPAVVAALNGEAATQPGAGLVPRWLDRLAQWSWRLLVVVAVAAVAIVALLQVPLILVPLVIAAVLAATLAPGVGSLLRRGLTPTTASLAMTVGGFGLVLVILVVTFGALVGPMQEIAAEARRGAELLDDVIASGQSVASIVAVIAPQLLAATSFLVAALVGLVISLVLGRDPDVLLAPGRRPGVRGRRPSTLARWRRDELEGAGARATGVLGGYMIGTGAISAVGAASQFLIMWLLGIPLAWPLAMLSFFGGFIPYIGSLLTTGLALLVTIAVGSDAGRADHADLHPRLQHRAGQHRGPARVQQGGQHPPGRRPAGDPGRGGGRRDGRDVPRRAGDRRRRDDVAHRAPGLRQRAGGRRRGCLAGPGSRAGARAGRGRRTGAGSRAGRVARDARAGARVGLRAMAAAAPPMVATGTATRRRPASPRR